MANNRILKLQDDKQDLIIDYGKVQEHVIHFYQKLFSRLDDTTLDIRGKLSQVVKNSLTEQQHRILMAYFSNDRIKYAVFCLKANKGLGPDWFPAEFLKITGIWQALL